MPPKPVFERSEYLGRAANVRRYMIRERIDGILLTGGPNLTYLSGYPSPLRSYARPFVFILPLEGEPTFIVHTGREFEARVYSWTPDVRTYATLSNAPVDEIERALRDHGLASARIGVEIGAEQTLDLPANGLDELRGRLPTVEFVDVGPVLWPARLRKSPAEIALIRRSCLITSEAHQRTFTTARSGMTEAEIARIMMTATIDLGGGAPFVLITSGDGNYDYVSKGPSDRRIDAGDLVWIDSGCPVGGYWSDFSRAGVVGGPSAEQTEAQAAIVEITRMGVGLVHPGARVADIARACNEAVSGLGLPVTSSVSGLAARVGHGMGLATTEPPSVAEDDETVFEPGMVITIEPGVATAFGTFHAEENVLVTIDGCEMLSTAPRDLYTIRL